MLRVMAGVLSQRFNHLNLSADVQFVNMGQTDIQRHLEDSDLCIISIGWGRGSCELVNQKSDFFFFTSLYQQNTVRTRLDSDLLMARELRALICALNV